ncbi:SDR family oxidoreductase [Kiritimatiella glycovorans]|uniref:Putative oxidoreductase n=1 Tax=Kiritimatiella glycovorans TaxID=1307763 RepID=A0A0G3EIG0_9BACT|nr:SDR family oxidoreductase [Kiritimatiella glycovorans]AKJ65227.1 putative oxidoreductase [Kiritimatiella glycovorans]
MSYLDQFFGLSGKVAVITGGGGVLAYEIGSGLSQAGVKIVFLDINEEAAQAAATRINEKGGDAIGLKTNVLDLDALKVTRDEVLAKYGKVDILLNAAGGNMPGATISPEQTVFDLNISDLDKVTSLNFNGTVLPSMVFGEVMAKQQSGNIINFSSMAAMQSITRVLGYSTAKAAVSNFTAWMAMEMAMKFGGTVRVNAIAPGFFIGNQNRALLTNPDGSYTDRGNKVINKTPMGRFGEARELVGAIMFLASDSAASFVTGIVLPIDGGFSTFSGV